MNAPIKTLIPEICEMSPKSFKGETENCIDNECPGNKNVTLDG